MDRYLGPVVALLACAATLGGASIQGIVVEKSTGRPVARARITIQALHAQSSSSPVFTDATGRFLISQLRAGAFLLSAERRGYAAAYYGQKRWNGPGTPIVIEQSSSLVVEIALNRLGAISGEIVDENGIGLPDVQVHAYRDGRPLRLAGQGMTNDRGEYRISGLVPGRYWVRTGPKELEDGTSLIPTYYGNAPAIENANTAEARLNEEITGISIRPLPGKLLHLAGMVAPPGAPSVTLFSGTGRRVAPVDASGRFAFGELSPGSVELITESGRGEAMYTAYANLWLSDNLDGVVLKPESLPRVQFRCEDQQGKPVAAKGISLTLLRTSMPEEPRTSQMECGKTAPAAVGSWQLSVSTPADYAVAGLQVQRRPIQSNEIQLLPGQQLEITLTASSLVSNFSGMLRGSGDEPAAGAMVFVRATESSVARRIFRKDTARTDASGRFAFAGLPPGRYQVASSFDVQTADEIDWNDATLPVVELEEGREASLDLKLLRRP